MKRLLIPIFAFLTLTNALYSSHLYNQKELIVTSESTKESLLTLSSSLVVIIGDSFPEIPINFPESINFYSKKFIFILFILRKSFNSRTVWIYMPKIFFHSIVFLYFLNWSHGYSFDYKLLVI